jgi:putative nucleotidyltransferase with HDIG domain
MMDRAARQQLYGEVVQRLSGALRAASLYSSAHPSVAEHIKALLEAVQRLHRVEPAVLIGFIGGEVIADDAPLLEVTTFRAELIRYMQALGINRVLLEQGVTLEEIATFVRAVSKPSHPAGRSHDTESVSDGDVDFIKLQHLRAGRIPVDTTAGRWGSSAVTMRQVYSGSIESARMIWESTRVEGTPDAPAAHETVDQLADAVDRSPGLMIGLTGMKEHDEYTFTHMVNVSVLTMAQARSLGIEGRQLRALGLAALLHDIGKVRTPLEILNKPATLTQDEMAIMRRHPSDGAAILRTTRDMPRLAAIVAFEHHVRRDGKGYPAGLTRGTINLATVLCGIADAYDAMRSTRVYQPASSSDRIMNIMVRNDGAQFDPALVRRFLDLMGVYPPATVVRLTSGEVAVVVENDGPDPSRPTVKVIFDAAGARLEHAELRSLWGGEAAGSRNEEFRIEATLDPATYSLDPLSYM